MSLWPGAGELRTLRDGAPWNRTALSLFLEIRCRDRRVRLFGESFAEIFIHGAVRRGLSVIGEIRADEVQTAQHGSVVFVENVRQAVIRRAELSEEELAAIVYGQPLPRHETDGWRTGGVIPYLPEVTLPPQGIFPYVHDAPIGASDKYLNAYAGLVKSDAFVLAAHVRPDPHEGVRVFVYGEPGETKEVVLFNGQDRGRATMVTFAREPRVYSSGVSQIVALSMAMAESASLNLDRTDEPLMLVEFVAPGDTRFHVLHPDGTLTNTH